MTSNAPLSNVAVRPLPPTAAAAAREAASETKSVELPVLSQEDSGGSTTSTGIYDTDSVFTTMTSLSTARLVQVDDSSGDVGGLTFPEPPSEEPSEAAAAAAADHQTKPTRPKSKLKQLKDKFKRNSKKASAEFSEF